MYNKIGEIMKKANKLEVKEFTEEQERTYQKVSKIILIIIFVLGILISCDILLVTKTGKGPFLAIPVKTYKDGGTKEYYGLGYKVIKYHQKVGRRDTVLGTWGLNYSTNPTAFSAMDLALEFRNYPKQTYKKLYKQFLKISGTLVKIDTKNKVLTIRYEDIDGGKYTLDIKCSMIDENLDLTAFETSQEITVIGTLTNYQKQTKTSKTTITLVNCFA